MKIRSKRHQISPFKIIISWKHAPEPPGKLLASHASQSAARHATRISTQKVGTLLHTPID